MILIWGGFRAKIGVKHLLASTDIDDFRAGHKYAGLFEGGLDILPKI